MKTYEERILEQYYKPGSPEMQEAQNRLQNHEPLAYIVGEAAFYGEMYYVDRSTLIPRPDTEHIVEAVIKHLPEGGKLLDLCTGSGCIGISSLCHTKNTEALLVDISAEAVRTARRNAERNGVKERVTALACDLNELLLEDSSFDIIASNPPYVRTDIVPTLEEECHYEPYIAFDGGETGMDFYVIILDRFKNALKENGKFIFEIGYDQGDDIKTLAESRGYACTVKKDYGQNDRVAILTKKWN